MLGSWTEEQLEAIGSSGGNILVSAAAGSGKTAVLIERIIRLITVESPLRVDIDRLLVVTFTKAAASEMKARLTERLSEMQRTDRGNAVLQKQLALLPRASISTFDSLCQRIVRENFVELNIDPSFKVGDDEELHMLRMQALDDVFEQRYINENFRALVETVCEKTDDFELRDTVLAVFDFVQSERAYRKWLTEKAEEYNLETLYGTFSVAAAFKYAQEELSEAYSLIKKAAAASEAPGGPNAYSAIITAEEEMLENALEAGDYIKLAGQMQNIVFGRLPAIRSGEADEGLKEEARERRNDAKKKVEKVKAKYFFKEENELLSDIKNAYPVLKTLSETVIEFSDRYMELKKERRILSFADIKLLCYDALVKDGAYTDAAGQYRNLFGYVLVDEYQDTNDVEEGILDAVSGRGDGNGNRFMVGDVKQSIYRFRQSKPRLFIDKSESYSELRGGRLITLHKNFRSREYILNAVNFIFSQIMTKNAAEIEYDKSAELVNGARLEKADAPEAIGITLIETDTIPEADEGEDAAAEAVNELKALEVEALYIAEKIYELVSGGQAKLSDIVILMRSGKRNGALFSDALSQKGISSFTEGKSGYFEMTEISDMLAILNIIDNPLQEIPLLTTLTSAVFNFSADELIEIRNANKGCFYEALTNYAKNNSGNCLSDKVSHFLEKLSEYRKIAARLPVGELLSFVYDDTDYYVIAGAMENGLLRQANLRDLLRRASEFENSAFPGLFHFVRYMERLRERDMLGQAELPETNDAVRIMTIHKSKGLEFPVVFLAGCGSKFNLRELNEKFILHQELGYGAVYVDYNKRVKSGTLPRSVVKEKLRREALAEEMRLLYVAMTRAKERLYITGSSGKDAERALGRWIERSAESGAVFSTGAVMGAQSYLDWIMPAALRSPSAESFLKGRGLNVQRVSNDYLEGSAFEISVYKRSGTVLNGKEDRRKLSRAEFERKVEEITRKAIPEINIDKLLNWKYNYESDIHLPVKLSVSEIKTQYQRLIAGETETGLSDLLQLDSDEEMLSMPVFMQETKGLSASEKGTAAHSVLARLDFTSARSEADVKAVMDELLEKKILNEKEYDCVSAADIAAFLRSEIAERIRHSANIRREVPFVIGITAAEAYLPPSGETVLVHGIIDCFFEENGKIIIVDYKTDYVPNEDFRDSMKKYKIQLEIYRKAAAMITQKPVSESYLYMLRYGRLISMQNGETT